MDHVTNYEVDDGFRITLNFDNGVRAYLEVARATSSTSPRGTWRVKNGTAQIDDFSCKGRIVCVENWEEKDVIPVRTAAGLTKTMAPRTDESITTHEVPQINSDVHDFLPQRRPRLSTVIEPQLITHPQMMRVMKLMEAAFESDRLTRSSASNKQIQNKKPHQKSRAECLRKQCIRLCLLL